MLTPVLSDSIFQEHSSQCAPLMCYGFSHFSFTVQINVQYVHCLIPEDFNNVGLTLGVTMFLKKGKLIIEIIIF